MEPNTTNNPSVVSTGELKLKIINLGKRKPEESSSAEVINLEDNSTQEKKHKKEKKDKKEKKERKKKVST
jgi:hypothetical protein